MRKAEAPTERLRHRVGEAEPGCGEGGARVHGAFEQPAPGFEVVRGFDDARKPLSDQARACERLAIAVLVARP